MKTCTACDKTKLATEFGLHHGDTRRNQCKACRGAAVLAWHRANRSSRAKHRGKWLANNAEKMQKMRAAWDKANPHKLAAKTRRYQAAKRHAVPAWADDEAMETVYQLARARSSETGVPHEVDHIVPLTSEFVCGLHCEHNLRVIPRFENRSNGNRHWPGMAMAAV